MHAAPPPRCGPAELRVSLGRTGAALGNVETPIVVRNVGGRACVVSGYVELALPVPWPVRRGTTYFHVDARPHPVLLRRGESAETEIAYNDVESKCVRPRWIEVLRRRVPFGRTICGVIMTPALEKRRP